MSTTTWEEHNGDNDNPNVFLPLETAYRLPSFSSSKQEIYIPTKVISWSTTDFV